VVLLRIGIVLSPEGGTLAQMMRPFRLRLGGPTGSGRQRISWIHVDDLVGMALFCPDHERLRGPVNATAPYPVTNRDFARILGRAMGRKSWFPVPGWMLRLALGEVADVALTGQRVLPRKALEAGFRFRHERLDEALGQILREPACP